ncbi:MAG: P-II family nitrogen regulator [Spirochaetaceae bacterium]|jgi:nitrogen regulatory protein PII 2|nr:P-II family nitrogen regulator [Spirochaetaceae bacterium]
MKMVTAILRPETADFVADSLAEAGFVSITKSHVFGRGKQMGITGEVDIEYRPHVLDEAAHRGMKYVPKRELSMVVKDSEVDRTVQTIIGINQSKQIGDGKIFVCPLDDALRVRTKETGDAALV